MLLVLWSEFGAERYGQLKVLSDCMQEYLKSTGLWRWSWTWNMKEKTSRNMRSMWSMRVMKVEHTKLKACCLRARRRAPLEVLNMVEVFIWKWSHLGTCGTWKPWSLEAVAMRDGKHGVQCEIMEHDHGALNYIVYRAWSLKHGRWRLGRFLEEEEET